MSGGPRSAKRTTERSRPAARRRASLPWMQRRSSGSRPGRRRSLEAAEIAGGHLSVESSRWDVHAKVLLSRRCERLLTVARDARTGRAPVDLSRCCRAGPPTRWGRPGRCAARSRRSRGRSAARPARLRRRRRRSVGGQVHSSPAASAASKRLRGEPARRPSIALAQAELSSSSAWR